MSKELKAMAKYLDGVLPEILWRCKWNEYKKDFGIPFGKGTMEKYGNIYYKNDDYNGGGPKQGVAGGKVFYMKKDFLKWLVEAKWL